MSKSAWLCLFLTVIAAVLGFAAESRDTATAAFIASGICACFWLMTLIVGRRIKFDPVLR